MLSHLSRTRALTAKVTLEQSEESTLLCMCEINKQHPTVTLGDPSPVVILMKEAHHSTQPTQPLSECEYVDPGEERI